MTGPCWPDPGPPTSTPCLACLTFTVNSPRLWFCWGGGPLLPPQPQGDQPQALVLLVAPCCPMFFSEGYGGFSELEEGQRCGGDDWGPVAPELYINVYSPWRVLRPCSQDPSVLTPVTAF